MANINLTTPLYAIFSMWLLFTSLVVYDYFHEITHPPSGFIPSSYDPPNFTLTIVVLVVMILELTSICWALYSRSRRSYPLRIMLLVILNVCWLFFSVWLGGTRPADPLIWHSLWLLLLEVILIIELFFLILQKLLCLSKLE